MPWRRPLILACLLLAGGHVRAFAQQDGLTGAWQGEFDGPGSPLGVVLRLQTDGADGWGGSIDVPSRGVFDQGARVTVNRHGLYLEFHGLGAAFSAVRDATGDTIAGLWMQDGGVAALRLVRASGDPDRRRPQDPVPPLPYAEVAVRFASADPTISLAGTLSVPPGAGPHPAVLLVSGSGPHDRDAAVAGHRPFLVLSDHLTRRGIAVLRVDDRGVGGSTGVFDDATTPDFALDALGAVRFLARHPAIDQARVGIVGHSEGGMVAPMVAARSDLVAFLVLLAAPGLPMPEVIMQQSAAMLRAEGRPDVEIAANVRAAARLARLVATGPDPATLERQARRIFQDRLAHLPLPDETRTRQVNLAVQQFTSPWMQFVARHDPRTDLRKLNGTPVLALNGAVDAQVLAQPNLAGIAQALAEAGNDRFTVLEIPGLNHLFQSAGSGAMSEYGVIEETFAPAALTLIGRWIESVTAPPL
ncbi:MAG TPA: alpha/beta fold hydrolase [Longimicrobiales bacterium]|nr:alpha/beta fold hydrolase [Longimicrobiales bacterium]